MNVLLIYEEIPERTVILMLSPADLGAANLKLGEIASLHGVYMNNSKMSAEQEEIYFRMRGAALGEWNDAKSGLDPALWQARVIFDTREPDLYKGGLPPTIGGDPGFVVVHTGFVM